jgi:hypothetical protein
MVPYVRLVLFALVLVPLVAAGQPGRGIIPTCPTDHSTKANTNNMTFTAFGTCDMFDMVYGVMFQDAAPDTPYANGAPGPNDDGGFDGNWVLRFKNLPNGPYVMRVVGWLSGESHNTSFSVGGTTGTDDCKPRKKDVAAERKHVEPGGDVTQPNTQVNATTKIATITGRVKKNSDDVKGVHAEISRVVCVNGKMRIQLIGEFISKERKNPTAAGFDVEVKYQLKDADMQPGSIYKVRLSAHHQGQNFNDYHWNVLKFQ